MPKSLIAFASTLTWLFVSSAAVVATKPATAQTADADSLAIERPHFPSAPT